jgi:hypothetical protein
MQDIVDVAEELKRSDEKLPPIEEILEEYQRNEERRQKQSMVMGVK